MHTDDLMTLPIIYLPHSNSSKVNTHNDSSPATLDIIWLHTVKQFVFHTQISNIPHTIL